MQLHKKRTPTIFSSSQHIRQVFRDSMGNKITVDTVQKSSSNEYIQFVNTPLAMSVFSSKVNLVFSTPLVPSAIGHVDDDYWLRLLKKNSLQEVHEYDAAATAKDIKEILLVRVKAWELEKEEEEEVISYLKELLECVDDEKEYLYRTHEKQPRPDIMGYNDIPLSYKVKQEVLVIFDAFEYICRQLKYANE